MSTNFEFRVNDLVFGKVRGYPHWTAKIINVDTETNVNVKKYKMKFFATDETANLNKVDICYYYEKRLLYTLESVALK